LPVERRQWIRIGGNVTGTVRAFRAASARSSASLASRSACGDFVDLLVDVLAHDEPPIQCCQAVPAD
jgi:hypothetical protein